jgi:hypothetical protein
MSFINKQPQYSDQSEFPLFLIVGAQKSGTTALFSYLTQHPKIVGARNKEVNFFNSPDRYALGESFYQSGFETSANDVIYLDASHSYLVNQDACLRIFEYNQKIKSIVIIRDPVDRAFSAWNMYRDRYRVNRNWFFVDWLPATGKSADSFRKRKDCEIEDFTSFISHEIEILLTDPNQAIESPVLPHGIYAAQIDRFVKLFSRDQLFVVESSIFRKDVSGTLRTIEEFIGIEKWDWSKADLAPVFEGKYTSRIPNSAQDMLSDFYALHNERLYEQIGRRFNWK